MFQTTEATPFGASPGKIAVRVGSKTSEAGNSVARAFNWISFVQRIFEVSGSGTALAVEAD